MYIGIIYSRAGKSIGFWKNIRFSAIQCFCAVPQCGKGTGPAGRAGRIRHGGSRISERPSFCTFQAIPCSRPYIIGLEHRLFHALLWKSFSIIWFFDKTVCYLRQMPPRNRYCTAYDSGLCPERPLLVQMTDENVSTFLSNNINRKRLIPLFLCCWMWYNDSIR